MLRYSICRGRVRERLLGTGRGRGALLSSVSPSRMHDSNHVQNEEDYSFVTLHTSAYASSVSSSGLLRPTAVLMKYQRRGRGRGRGRGAARGMEREPRAGDWTCSCGVVNGISRRECFKCAAPAPPLPLGRSRPRMPGEDPNDWACPCGKMNFRGSVNCFKCQMPKPVPPPEPGKEITFWTCGKCRSMSRSNKRFCFRCGAPQTMAVEPKPPPTKNFGGDESTDDTSLAGGDPYASAFAGAAATAAMGSGTFSSYASSNDEEQNEQQSDEFVPPPPPPDSDEVEDGEVVLHPAGDHNTSSASHEDEYRPPELPADDDEFEKDEVNINSGGK